MVTMYLATINIPGYLPMEDDPPVFATAAEAWDYLAGERERSLNDAAAIDDIGTSFVEDGEWRAMFGMDHPGTVYGDTPGYDGDHDLGLAYCVTEVEAVTCNDCGKGVPTDDATPFGDEMFLCTECAVYRHGTSD